MTWLWGPLVVATALGSHFENRVCTGGLSDLEAHLPQSSKNSSWRQVTSSKQDSKPTRERESQTHIVCLRILLGTQALALPLFPSLLASETSLLLSPSLSVVGSTSRLAWPA